VVAALSYASASVLLRAPALSRRFVWRSVPGVGTECAIDLARPHLLRRHCRAGPYAIIDDTVRSIHPLGAPDRLRHRLRSRMMDFDRHLAPPLSIRLAPRRHGSLKRRLGGLRVTDTRLVLYAWRSTHAIAALQTLIPSSPARSFKLCNNREMARELVAVKDWVMTGRAIVVCGEGRPVAYTPASRPGPALQIDPHANAVAPGIRSSCSRSIARRRDYGVGWKRSSFRFARIIICSASYSDADVAILPSPFQADPAHGGLLDRGG